MFVVICTVPAGAEAPTTVAEPVAVKMVLPNPALAPLTAARQARQIGRHGTPGAGSMATTPTSDCCWKPSHIAITVTSSFAAARPPGRIVAALFLSTRKLVRSVDSGTLNKCTCAAQPSCGLGIV